MNTHAKIDTDALPRWDLSDLYSSRSDPRIAADLEASKALNSELAAMEGQFLAARAKPAELGALIAKGVGLYQDATQKLWRVGSYATLAASTARGDPAWAKFEADFRDKAAQIGAMSLFFTLELNQLEDSEIAAALAADPAALAWKPWLRQVRLNRPHELSPDLERMLIDRAPAVASWSRLYDETLARMKVRIGRHDLDLTTTLSRLSDPREARRRAAAEGLARALAENEPVLGLCLNTLAAEKATEDRWRKFPSPAASRHLANEVDQAAVDALEAAVVEAYPRLSHRYNRLKAKLIGMSQLEYWDRNAPLTAARPRLYDWEEARGVVLESFTDLAPAFSQIADRFFHKPWIDAAPRRGKTSGAYSHSTTPDVHPYVFLNFMGERRDVLTLAHELGHAVHQTLAAPLGVLKADTPLTLAETASIFGEGLVFDRLLAQATPADRRALLAGKIEDGLNTVVRQIAFHRFETRFHARRQAGEVSAEEIGEIWMEVMGESLGPAVHLGEGYEHYWAYVSHFVHSPFYVYAYAFGDLLVRALMEKRRADPAGFA
ncbi:MAG: oligoendopeptidase pepF/M3 family, partial [Caulobacteraceae bacterium]|nr:oligoendopeptidase pepF/M3 family [Caulobacteraceae bacterium]